MLFKENYGIYAELIEKGRITIYTKDLTIENLMDHFNWVLNIFKDSIEEESTHMLKVDVVFTDGMNVTLSLFEYFTNLIFWYAPLRSKDNLTSRFFFWVEDFTARCIENEVNDNFLDIHREDFSEIELNQIIDDLLELFKVNDQFSYYYMNTINLDDFVYMMMKDKEVYDYLHTDVSNIPLEDIKNYGMDITNKLVDKIKHSNHCLADALGAKENINLKQFREYVVNNGTIVDGNGSVFSSPVNSSFIDKGVSKIKDMFEESYKGRNAQAINKENVGDSGSFARLLALNSMESFLNEDPNYFCRTRNFVRVTIKNETILNMFKNRYYRIKPEGIERKISMNPLRYNRDLIGKTLYFRSPMTCHSNVTKRGICRRCYGDLYYINTNVNIGQIAAELLSSKLTQMLLSAKHLLESRIQKLSFNDYFNRHFIMEENIVKVNGNTDPIKGCYLLINYDNIKYENEDDNIEFNMYCNSFSVQEPDGTVYEIYTENEDNFYFSKFLSLLMNDSNLYEDVYSIPLESLVDKDLFLINIANSELSQTLKHFKTILDKKSSTINTTKDKFLEELIDTCIEGNIRIDSIHLEVIVSNQIRKFIEEETDILELPDWSIPNEKYTLISLKQALSANPSITISLQFQYIKRILTSPLTYKKTQPSSVDLLFMEKPQEFIKMKPPKKNYKIEDDKYRPVKFD